MWSKARVFTWVFRSLVGMVARPDGVGFGVPRGRSVLIVHLPAAAEDVHLNAVVFRGLELPGSVRVVFTLPQLPLPSPVGRERDNQLAPVELEDARLDRVGSVEHV